MITVWTACTGDAYDLDEVYTLKRQVDRHLKAPHIFNCITEHDIPGISVYPPVFLPGWWIKLTLFGGFIANPRNLWLDLDVTITQDIDALVEPLNGSQLRIAKNWAQSGHGGCQSSVMYWEGVKAESVYDSFDHADAHWPPRNDLFWDNGQVQWGDQEWITYCRDKGMIDVEYFDPAHVVSYKYHCCQGLPKDSKIQVFHGKPDPCEVNDDWVKQARV